MRIYNMYKSIGYFSYQIINYLNNYIINSLTDDMKNMNINTNKYNMQKIDRSLYNSNDDKSNDDNSYGFFVILDE